MKDVDGALARASELQAAGQHREASKLYAAILEVSPTHASALHGMGISFYALKDIDLAICSMEKSIRSDSSVSVFHSNISEIYREAGQIDKALHHGKIAIEIDASNINGLINLGMAYFAKGSWCEAESCFEQAASLDKTSVLAHLGAASCSKELGDMEGAIERFERVLTLAPNNVRAMYGLAQCLDKEDRIDEAWEMYMKGAIEKRKEFPEIGRTQRQRVDRIKRLFTPDFMDEIKINNPSNKPIFICGMPRSGTTLVEQIISSHPEVCGAGEIRDLFDITKWDDSQFPRNIEDMTVSQLKRAADQYLHRLRLYSNGEPRVTDKFLANYNHIGLIHCLFPNAKIIVLRRNPMDVLFSCFAHLFKVNQVMSYNLIELCESIRLFDELINHWDTVLPDGSFSQVSYEKLVENTESEVRGLLEFCELEWDDACLKFYDNQREVKTASKDQVNKPIYTSSINKWRRFEKHLHKYQCRVI